MVKPDFGGWATVANMKCSDGRVIEKNAFIHCDGQKVPLVWNHQHNDPNEVLGHALLENREEGVYTYGFFNETESGQKAKELVKHGDITALSIYANRLKQNGSNVTHGIIREVSLVMAGANPGAFIDSFMAHGEDSDDEAVIYTDEEISLTHSEDEKENEEMNTEEQIVETEEVVETKDTQEDNLAHAEEESGETVADVFNTLTDKQKKVVYALIGQALSEKGSGEEDDNDEKEINHSEGGNDIMKNNVFDNNDQVKGAALSHADQEAIIAMAKQSNVGSFKQALQIFAESNDMLKHSEDGVGVFEDYGVLFPELELLKKGEPETLYKYDQSWVSAALRKIHKSPFSRIRTRHADARTAELKAMGYQKKGDEKTLMGQIKMINRETTPQTIYIKDALHRDDVIDITDFSIVEYQWKQMRTVLDETMIMAALVGDRREEGDPDKIHEEHVRSIWNDNEEYTIHQDVDIAAAKAELQGSETGAHFGDNYIYAEAIITAALYSREKFKGTGAPDFYCTPHLVNVMLLARDLNGRRIYDSKADLAKALNCNSIVEVEQFEGLVRTTEGGDKKKLLGLFVNLNDYTFGSTRGGEITRFEDFDMDFNLKKFMLETRLSGSLYKLKSAIALEEPVDEAAG